MKIHFKTFTNGLQLLYIKQVQASQRSNVGTIYTTWSFNWGIMSIVSDKAQIREMDAGEIKELWDKANDLPLFTEQHERELNELYYDLNKQYFQLTGKTLN